MRLSLYSLGLVAVLFLSASSFASTHNDTNTEKDAAKSGTWSVHIGNRTGTDLSIESPQGTQPLASSHDLDAVLPDSLRGSTFTVRYAQCT